MNNYQYFSEKYRDNNLLLYKMPIQENVWLVLESFTSDKDVEDLINAFEREDAEYLYVAYKIKFLKKYQFETLSNVLNDYNSNRLKDIDIDRGLIYLPTIYDKFIYYANTELSGSKIIESANEIIGTEEFEKQLMTNKNKSLQNIADYIYRDIDLESFLNNVWFKFKNEDLTYFDLSFICDVELYKLGLYPINLLFNIKPSSYLERFKIDIYSSYYTFISRDYYLLNTIIYDSIINMSLDYFGGAIKIKNTIFKNTNFNISLDYDSYSNLEIHNVYLELNDSNVKSILSALSVHINNWMNLGDMVNGKLVFEYPMISSIKLENIVDVKTIDLSNLGSSLYSTYHNKTADSFESYVQIMFCDDLDEIILPKTENDYKLKIDIAFKNFDRVFKFLDSQLEQLENTIATGNVYTIINFMDDEWVTYGDKKLMSKWEDYTSKFKNYKIDIDVSYSLYQYGDAINEKIKNYKINILNELSD